MTGEIAIREFAPKDAVQVRDLFIRVNRLLSPPEMKDAFEAYITTSLKEEVDRITNYYGDKNGGFWVAVDGGKLVGIFGLEPSSATAMELRRMYVDPDARRRGVARKMLQFAEAECRRRDRPTMDLSTSELQGTRFPCTETSDINLSAKRLRSPPATRLWVVGLSDTILRSGFEN